MPENVFPIDQGESIFDADILPSAFRRRRTR